MKNFKIGQGSVHHQFLQSRAKIQIFGGGYGNGKTAAASVKGMTLALDYAGSNGLIARSTYPKLADTIMLEFQKWCPKDWIKRFPQKPPTLHMHNGSVVNFRYVQQQGKSEDRGQSNLLSATYDWITVDQLDDPEFEEKDFLDLLGRLRGATPYTGSDLSMPRLGPGFIMITLNPTRNWFYRNYIRHLLDYKERGLVSRRLREMLDKFETERVEDLFELFEGPTDINSGNLQPEYLKTLKATYSGVMADRYIKGEWGAFEGLVYPMFDEYTHLVSENDILLWKHRSNITQWIEMFDYGLRAPNCYMLAFADDKNNIVVVDGFHEVFDMPQKTVAEIRRIRKEWNVPVNTNKDIWSDPSIFRKQAGEFKTVGKSVAEILNDEGRGIHCCRGNNDILSGMVKVRSYLERHRFNRNPFTGETPAPFLYFNRDKMLDKDGNHFILSEISDYMFENPDDNEEESEKPVDRNDHAMDALKYGLTSVPDIVKLLPKPKPKRDFISHWTEAPDEDRYGSAA